MALHGRPFLRFAAKRSAAEKKRYAMMGKTLETHGNTLRKTFSIRSNHDNSEE